MGYYTDEEEGARAYDKAILDMRGFQAELNFPDDVEIPNLAHDFQSEQEPVAFPVGDAAALDSAFQSILDAWRAGGIRSLL